MTWQTFHNDSLINSNSSFNINVYVPNNNVKHKLTELKRNRQIHKYKLKI